MRIALDSNVLLYAEGLNDGVLKAEARRILRGLEHHDFVIPLQVLGEMVHVLRRKLKYTSAQAIAAITDWREYASVEPGTTSSVFEAGSDLAVRHDLQTWDAIILAASAEAGCTILLSEDMKDGFVWRGVTIANPFAPTLHPLLADALAP